jgi:hypothetical protein
MFFANARVHKARVLKVRVLNGREDRIAMLPAGCGAGREALAQGTKEERI